MYRWTYYYACVRVCACVREFVRACVRASHTSHTLTSYLDTHYSAGDANEHADRGAQVLCNSGATSLLTKHI